MIHENEFSVGSLRGDLCSKLLTDPWDGLEVKKSIDIAGLIAEDGIKDGYQITSHST